MDPWIPQLLRHCDSHFTEGAASLLRVLCKGVYIVHETAEDRSVSEQTH